RATKAEATGPSAARRALKRMSMVGATVATGVAIGSRRSVEATREALSRTSARVRAAKQASDVRRERARARALKAQQAATAAEAARVAEEVRLEREAVAAQAAATAQVAQAHEAA